MDIFIFMIQFFFLWSFIGVIIYGIVFSFIFKKHMYEYILDKKRVPKFLVFTIIILGPIICCVELYMIKERMLLQELSEIKFKKYH